MSIDFEPDIFRMFGILAAVFSMNNSWRVARIAGVDVSIHWTFALLLGWVLWTTARTAGFWFGVGELLFVLALFTCVVLHEFGHAFAARLFGIPTHGITLLPIGGVAQLDRIPRDSRQELMIALAGPAVNVFLVGLLFPLVTILRGAAGLGLTFQFSSGFVERLLWMNLALVLFNLIPAFPMDGGRVLRALLATRLDYVRATLWAKRVASIVASLLLIVGVYLNPPLILIAAFVVWSASAEYRTVLHETYRNNVSGSAPAFGPLAAWESPMSGARQPAKSIQDRSPGIDLGRRCPLVDGRLRLVPTGVIMIQYPAPLRPTLSTPANG